MGTEKATPFNYQLGTLDDTVRARSVLPKRFSQFLPVFMLDTQRGGYTTQRVSGNLTDFIYGSETLNKLGSFANHASVFAAGALGAGGQILIQRLPFVPPADNPTATGIADITIYVNLSVETAGDKYLRNADGSVQKDGAGNVQYDGTAGPINVRFISLSSKSGVTAGDIVNTTGGFTLDTGDLDVVSYPILTIKGFAHGNDYNNFGLAFTALTGDEASSEMTSINELETAIAVYYNSYGKTRLLKTETSARYVSFSLKDKAINPVTKAANEVGDKFPKEYGFKPSPTDKQTIYDFQNIIKYQSNIDLVLKEVSGYELEQGVGETNTYSDFISIDAEDMATNKNELFAMANLFTNKYSSGAKYEYVRQATSFTPSADLVSATGKTFTASLETPVFLEGGLDNDMTTEQYEDAVSYELSRYSDPDDVVSELAINPVSVFIDSGFSFATSMKFGKFLGYRKDVFLLASTYEVDVSYAGSDKQPIADAISKGALLKSNYKLYPESTLFGTATSKAAIVMGSCLLEDGTYRKRVPLTYDLMIKMVKFMGAGTGEWNGAYRFSRQPGNIVNSVVDVHPSHIPNSIKNKLWDTGLIWVQNEDTDTFFYPASQTIYDNDTSVLKAIPVNIALCYIVKQEEAVWREFSGADDLENIQLKLLAEDSMRKRLANKFADSYRLVPEVFYTQADVNRGYSYKLVVHLYASNMKTVQESYTIVHRKSDLA